MNQDLNFDEIVLEDLDLNNYNNEDEATINVPHLKVDTKDFTKCLNVAKQLLSSSAKDIISKSICLKRDGNSLIMYSTDYDNYLVQSMDLLNTEFILDEEICVPMQTMATLLKAVPSNLVIYKDEDNYKIKLYAGEVVLEAHSIEVSKFQFPHEMEQTPSMIKADTMLAVMKDFNNLVTCGITPQDRRISMGKDKAISSYLFSAIRCMGNFTNFDLKLKDISILKSLVKENCDLAILKSKDKSYTKVEGENFYFYFLNSNLQKNVMLEDAFNQANFDNGVFVDLIQLYKVCELSSVLDYATSRLKLEFKDNNLFIDFATKKGEDTQFTINGTVDGAITPNIKVEIDSKMLVSILKCFHRSNSVKINISKEMLTISNDVYQAVYMLGI